MDQNFSLDGVSPTSRRQEDSDFVNSETANQAEHVDLTDLTPDQIEIILHPPIRSGLELDWPASPRLATVELQPDDAESSHHVGPFLGSHANGLAHGWMLQLNTDHSLLLNPVVPQVMQEHADWEVAIDQPQDAAQPDISVLTPLTEIDEALSARAIRQFEVPGHSDGFIVVFADGTWVIVLFWLIDTGTFVPNAH